jgi:hypothetical protein
MTCCSCYNYRFHLKDEATESQGVSVWSHVWEELVCVFMLLFDGSQGGF